TCDPSDPALLPFSALSLATIGQMQSEITALEGQIAFLTALRTSIQQVPDNRTDFLLEYAEQLQQYLEQSGGDWITAQQEREAAITEKNQLQSQQLQIQSALSACKIRQALLLLP
ncbi:MAG: hypothetical protein Q8Q41_01855, partial [bacterium]|nr:hypothetical protein [bacterium]